MNKRIEMLDYPDANVSIKMQCEDCGHVQIVKGIRRDNQCYFGSAYNWCNACDTGLPVQIEDMKVEK